MDGTVLRWVSPCGVASLTVARSDRTPTGTSVDGGRGDELRPFESGPPCPVYPEAPLHPARARAQLLADQGDVGRSSHRDLVHVTGDQPRVSRDDTVSVYGAQLR